MYLLQSPTPTPAPAPKTPHNGFIPDYPQTLLGGDLLRAALNLPRRWAVDVVVWDPVLVVRLLCQVLCGDSWSVRANDAQLLIGRHSFGTTQRAARTLASLTSALGLGEESLNPGLVHGVECSSGSRGKNKVKEDAGGPVSSDSIVACILGMGSYIWGSKKLVGASTTLTVSWNAGT